MSTTTNEIMKHLSRIKKNYTIELDIKSEDIDPSFVKYLQEEINK